MAYDLVEESFTTWKESYTQSGFVRMCDGRNIAKQYNSQTEKVESWMDLTEHLRPACLKAQGMSCDCKPRGVLTMILPELKRLGAVLMSTTSIIDISNILGQLNYLDSLAKENGATIRQIPMRISRYPKEMSFNYPDGRRGKSTHHLVRLEAHPDWVKMHFAKIFTSPQLTGGQRSLEQDGFALRGRSPGTRNDYHRAQLSEPTPTQQTPQSQPSPVEPTKNNTVIFERLQQTFQRLEWIGDRAGYQTLLANIVLKQKIPSDWEMTFPIEQIEMVLDAAKELASTFNLPDEYSMFMDQTLQKLREDPENAKTFDLKQNLMSIRQNRIPEDDIPF